MSDPVRLYMPLVSGTHFYSPSCDFRNPGGIRFGSSEIYDVIDSCFGKASSSHAIVDSLVVGQTTQGGADERVVLFVCLPEGMKLDESLVKTIQTQVRVRRTARHVPEKIVQVGDIPYTLNGKKVEVPIKKVSPRAPLTDSGYLEQC